MTRRKLNVSKYIIVIIVLLICWRTLPSYGEVIVIEPTSESPANEKDMEGIVLSVGEEVREEGNYSIEIREALSDGDDFIKEGNFMSYLTTEEDGGELKPFEWKVGTYAPLGVYINFTNLSKTNTDPTKRVECKIFYDDNYEYTTIPLIYNPDQMTEDGLLGYSSTKARPVEPLITVKMGFKTAVPFIVRDSDKDLVAYLTIDKKEVYTVNLRSILEIR